MLLREAATPSAGCVVRYVEDRGCQPAGYLNQNQENEVALFCFLCRLASNCILCLGPIGMCHNIGVFTSDLNVV